MAYDNTNRGVLFINDKKGKDKAPDRTGTINVNGVDYKLAGWLKEGKNGPFLSLSVSEKKDAERPAKDVNEDKGGGNTGDMPDDEVPFISNKGAI